MTTKPTESPIKRLGFRADLRKLSPLLSANEQDAFELSYTAADLVSAVTALRHFVPKYGAAPIAALVRTLANRLRLDSEIVKLAGRIVTLAKPKKAR